MHTSRSTMLLSLCLLASSGLTGCMTFYSFRAADARYLRSHRSSHRATAEGMVFRSTRPTQYAYTEDDARNTFAVDVDRASYDLVRRMLNAGRPVPPEAVRTEEFVNAQDYGYGSPASGALAIHTEFCPAPFRDGMHLLRVAIQAKRVHPADRTGSNLVLVLDTSGSMADDGKFDLVREAVRILLAELDKRDKVAVVAYDAEAREIVPFVRAAERGAILHAIDQLRPQGRTSIEAALTLAYSLARTEFDDDRVNRLILFSDGVANEDRTEPESILCMARDWSDDGIALTTVGVGFGEYNDYLLEQLANQGDGNYGHIDSVDEARSILGYDFIQLGQAAATNVRVQVRFDDDVVRRYRLMGYDNRELTDDEFTDSCADGGEMGVGQSVTALYAIELRNPGKYDNDETFATVHVRYDKPGGWFTRKAKASVRVSDAKAAFEDATSATRLAAAGAYFAEWLRGTYWSRFYKLQDIRTICERVDPPTRARKGRDRLLAMIDAAGKTTTATTRPVRSGTATDDGWFDVPR